MYVNIPSFIYDILITSCRPLFFPITSTTLEKRTPTSLRLTCLCTTVNPLSSTPLDCLWTTVVPFVVQVFKTPSTHVLYKLLIVLPVIPISTYSFLFTFLYSRTSTLSSSTPKNSIPHLALDDVRCFLNGYTISETGLKSGRRWT